jgi:hypothetical protein
MIQSYHLLSGIRVHLLFSRFQVLKDLKMRLSTLSLVLLPLGALSGQVRSFYTLSLPQIMSMSTAGIEEACWRDFKIDMGQCCYRSSVFSLSYAISSHINVRPVLIPVSPSSQASPALRRELADNTCITGYTQPTDGASVETGRVTCPPGQACIRFKYVCTSVTSVRPVVQLSQLMMQSWSISL